MSREARIFAEGSLRWVQASGTGGWATASAPTSALVGFVQAGLATNSAQKVVAVMERGRPHHQKIVGWEPITIDFTYLQAVTANMAAPATASGASVPEVHFELKSTDSEAPASTGQYWQITNAVMVSRGWTETENGNQFKESWQALGMLGPVASGYLG